MIDPQTSEYYEQNAAVYAAETAIRGVSSSLNRFCDGLPARSTIIDVGCGGGRDLLEFRTRGYFAVGLDSSGPLAAIAAEFSGCPVAEANILRIPFVSESFDAAWSSASLLHFDEHEVKQALREIFRVVRVGGKFFSSVKRGEGTMRDKTGRRFTYHQPDDWVNLIDASGFAGIEVLHDKVEEMVDSKWIRVIAYRRK